jgi:hypothetical protein
MPEIKDGKLAIPCPDCGEMSPEPIDRLLDNDVIPCSICGGLMDLSTEECRPLVEQARTYAAAAR